MLRGNEYFGWICPKCGKVNAPMILECPCGVKDSDTYTPWYPDYPIYPTRPYYEPIWISDAPPAMWSDSNSG